MAQVLLSKQAAVRHVRAERESPRNSVSICTCSVRRIAAKVRKMYRSLLRRTGGLQSLRNLLGLKINLYSSRK